MKITSFILITCISFITYSQRNSVFVDGPANFRLEANGQKLFSVNNNVSIQIRSVNGKWSVARLICYVNKEALVDRNIIKENTSLLDYKGDSIGFTFTSFEVANNYDKKYWKYDEKEQIRIALEGYTYEGNIKEELDIIELLKSKRSFSDSCSNTFLNYREESGLSITKMTKCDIFSTSIHLNDTRYGCIVRKQQNIKLIGGAEGQESKIKLTISNRDDEFQPFEFTTEADELFIEGGIIKSVKYGCCGAEDSYKLFNSSTLKEVMSYKARLYQIEIPNSKIKGYIGYTSGSYYPNDNGQMILGTLEFSDGKQLLKKIHFETKSKELFDQVSRFVPEMEFIPLGERDKIKKEGQILILWSKNNSTNLFDLWNFGFKVNLVVDSTGESFNPTLTFKDGKVNNLDVKEITVFID